MRPMQTEAFFLSPLNIDYWNQTSSSTTYFEQLTGCEGLYVHMLDSIWVYLLAASCYLPSQYVLLHSWVLSIGDNDVITNMLHFRLLSLELSGGKLWCTIFMAATFWFLFWSNLVAYWQSIFLLPFFFLLARTSWRLTPCRCMRLISEKLQFTVLLGIKKIGAYKSKSSASSTRVSAIIISCFRVFHSCYNSSTYALVLANASVFLLRTYVYGTITSLTMINRHALFFTTQLLGKVKKQPAFRSLSEN
jgi:hypothetical protein